MNFWLTMLGLAGVSIVQNAAFTAVSRSRNSGDVRHHFKWAIASNGVWFVAQLFIWSTVWHAVETGNWWQIAVGGTVYVASTTFGSVWMMARMLKTETGKQKVGAR
ncbi:MULTISPECIES: hypothetical protein [Mesorhizobium]|uniref:hypothetical protein n=1 Tax=Mesorhizobium TaxID=68287 RepID=UPI0007A9400B|nr:MULTISPECIES: hypothetical protein [Mesorhizobium]AMX93705.1 hypothetical protein A4R28_11635 [Mesorhizobium ciceri]MDF3208404.1 hypothetical protein [Mesorhizobium sp. LMG15046]MDF3229025.1 hypothetical protein [Mesorhizobium sp. DSM 30133]RUU22141.1 hypothetical protein EOC84_03255 [Mesorhizobium sp. Primo-B]RUU37949.1 hypothetical protein EOC83_16960 [Mesorhizobium sp. Primo-A]